MTIGLSIDGVAQAPHHLSLAAPVRRILRNKYAVVALALIVMLLLAALIGPAFLPNSNQVTVTDALKSPSSQHLLGTDDLGRDILARVFVGARVSYFVALCATVTAVAPAVVLGVAAGFFGGIVDDVLARIFDILLAIPTLLLAIVIVAAVGPSLLSIVIAIGVADIPRYGRLTRALTMRTKEAEYVKSGVALGYSSLRLMLRHVLPNIYVSVLIIATGRFGAVVLAEASLSFLGVGIQPPNPSLGNMIAEGQDFLSFDPLFSIAPGIALTIITVSFCFFGDGLRDAFDVRDQGGVR